MSIAGKWCSVASISERSLSSMIVPCTTPAASIPTPDTAQLAARFLFHGIHCASERQVIPAYETH
eukprot:3776868-Rhodomonas_salina.1